MGQVPANRETSAATRKAIVLCVRNGVSGWSYLSLTGFHCSTDDAAPPGLADVSRLVLEPEPHTRLHAAHGEGEDVLVGLRMRRHNTRMPSPVDTTMILEPTFASALQCFPLSL